MDNRTRSIIDYAYDDNGAEMRDALYAEIQDRVMSHLDNMKSQMAQSLFATESYGTHDDKEEEKEDEKLIKKMVKKDSLKTEAWDDDEDDDVAKADRELKRMGAKPIKAAKGIDPDKDISKLAKKTPKDEVDESFDPEDDEWDEDFEALDEVSRDLVRRYINKTKPEYSSPKEIEKRKAGRSLALKKYMGDKKFGFPEPKVKATD